MTTVPGFRAVSFVLVCALACWAMPQLAAAQAASSEAEFVYRFRPRDTLIGVSRRLLQQPQRWPQLQSRNHIADPHNIPPDTPVRIPYSWLRLSADTARVLTVSGTVTRDGTPVLAGEVLASGSVLHTGDDGSATLEFADGSLATLQKSSVLRLEQLQRVEGVSDGHAARLKLESGRVETSIKPKRDVGRFEIVTPVAVSAVRGTQFRTGFNAVSGDATTETLEGTVQVAAQNEVTVPAGFGTRVEKGGLALSPEPLLPAPDLSNISEAHSQATLRVQLPPVPGATSYRLQLSADAQFHAISVDALSTEPDFTVAALGDGGYWLRARAIDRHGIEGADAVRQITQHVLPESPALLAPGPDARIVNPATHEWRAVGNAAGYRVQVARDATFTDLVADRRVLDTNQLLVEQMTPGAYFWRVASDSVQGETGEWSAAQSYVQRPAPPTVDPPTLQRRAVALRWAGGAGDSWCLQVARDAAFEHIVIDQSRTVPELTIPKLAPGTYYARVQAIDSAGNADPFGAARPFDVAMPRWMKLLLSSTILVPFLL
ncbi:MAG: FecR domain-containing protein [Pseudomonadota bacterium]